MKSLVLCIPVLGFMGYLQVVPLASANSFHSGKENFSLSPQDIDENENDLGRGELSNVKASIA